MGIYIYLLAIVLFLWIPKFLASIDAAIPPTGALFTSPFPCIQLKPWWTTLKCRFSKCTRSYAMSEGWRKLQIAVFAMWFTYFLYNIKAMLARLSNLLWYNDEFFSNGKNWDLKFTSPFQHYVWPRTTSRNDILLLSIANHIQENVNFS